MRFTTGSLAALFVGYFCFFFGWALASSGAAPRAGMAVAGISALEVALVFWWSRED